MLNYHYDKDQGTYELYFNDELLVELPYADPMTDAEASTLADELFKQHLENQNA